MSSNFIWFGKQHDWMVSPLKAWPRISNLLVACGFLLWHSKWAEWSVSQNSSDLCWKMFIFVTFKLFPWFCDWNKWIQMCTVYKIQWHHVMCGNDQQCLFHLAHRYFTFPVNFPYLYTALNTFRSASWVFFSLSLLRLEWKSNICLALTYSIHYHKLRLEEKV